MLKGREVLKGGGCGGDIEGKGGVGMEGDGQTSLLGMGARSSSVIVPVVCPCRRVSSSHVFVISVHHWWCWGPCCHSSVVGGALFAICWQWCGASFAVGGVGFHVVVQGWWWWVFLSVRLHWRALVTHGRSMMVVWWVLEIVVVVLHIVEGGGGGGHSSPVIVEGGGDGHILAVATFFIIN